MKTFHLTITDITTSLFEGDVQSVACTGVSGDMVVLPGHMPLVTTLKPCEIRVINSDGVERRFPVARGILEVSGKNVTILL